MVPLIPIVAALAVGGYLYSRSKGTAAKAPAGIPPYDVGLDSATAQAVDWAIKGGIAEDGSAIPRETDPAHLRGFITRLAGYPIAQAALTRYLATLGGGAASSPTYAASTGSTASSGGGVLSNLFGGGGAPAASSSSTSSTPNVRDVRTAQTALVAWNKGAGAGAATDFGKQVASDVDGIGGPRTVAATKAFQKWNNARGATQLDVDGKLGPSTYAALEPYYPGAGGAPSSSSSNSSFITSITASPPPPRLGGVTTMRKF